MTPNSSCKWNNNCFLRRFPKSIRQTTWQPDGNRQYAGVSSSSRSGAALQRWAAHKLNRNVSLCLHEAIFWWMNLIDWLIEENSPIIKSMDGQILKICFFKNVRRKCIWTLLKLFFTVTILEWIFFLWIKKFVSIWKICLYMKKYFCCPPALYRYMCLF